MTLKTIFFSSANRIRNFFQKREFQGRTHDEIFESIYEKNYWGSAESRSGSGSSENQTSSIIGELPKLFEKYSIKSLLDIPCGDFNWMQRVDLDSIDYLGADIVASVIDRNKKGHASESVRFAKLSLTESQLPDADLILCRDCFVHFSFADIKKGLANLGRTKSKYLLTTTFVRRKRNEDIQTGLWRPINLEIAPFHFPSPITIISENCTEADGVFSDKSLALWDLKTIRSLPFLAN